MSLPVVQVLLIIYFVTSAVVNPQEVSPKCAVLSATAPCSDMCDELNGIVVRPDFGPNLANPDCFTLDAFPMYTPKGVLVHVRFRIKSPCAINTGPKSISLAAVNMGWRLIGTWMSPAPQFTKAACPDEDDFFLKRSGSAPPNKMLLHNRCLSYSQFTNYLRVDLRPGIAITNDQSNPGFCSIWQLLAGTKQSAVRFIGEIVHTKDAHIYAPKESSYLLKVQSPVYLFEDNSKTSTTVTGCHNSALYTEKDSIFKLMSSAAITTTDVISPKCLALPTMTEPCNDLCVNYGSGIMYPRPLVDPKCYELDAFPMYKPQPQIHVRFRIKAGCSMNTVPIFLSVQGVDSNWLPVGIWRSPASELADTTSCTGEDAFIIMRKGSTPPELFPSEDVDCKTTPKASLLGVPFNTSIGKPVSVLDPGFCAIWMSTVPSTTVRFIGQIIDTVGKSAPELFKVQSPLYYFDNTTGKVTSNLQGCHEPGLLKEPASILVLETDRTATTTTTSTTMATTVSTTKPTTSTTEPTTKTTTKPPTPKPRPPPPPPPPPIIIASNKTRNTTEGPPPRPVTLTRTKEQTEAIMRKRSRFHKECQLTAQCITGQSPDCSEKDRVNGVHNGKKGIKMTRGTPVCIRLEDCPFVVSYGKRMADNVEIPEDQILIEMSGDSIFWIAIGFSRDDKMGDDFVVECVNDNSVIRIYTSWNYLPSDAVPNKRLDSSMYTEGPNNNPVVRLLDGSLFEKRITCSFALKKYVSFTLGGRKRVLQFDKSGFHTLMAYGSTNGEFVDRAGFQGNLNNHGTTNRLYSPVNYYYGDQYAPSVYQLHLIQWHGYIMCGLWMFIVPVNNFICRHYKETFQATKIFGVKLWFFLHIVLAVVGLIVLFVGHGLLTEANNSWHSLVDTYVDGTNYHLWFSLAASSLFFVNFFTGLLISETLRGQPWSVLSCNFGHSLIGHVSYACSLASMYSSTYNLHSNLSCAIKTVVIVWATLYHLYAFGIMGYHGLWVNWMIKLVENTHIQPLRLYQDAQHHARAESPGSRWRIYSFIVFFLLTIACYTAMVLMVMDNDEENSCHKLETFVTTDMGERTVNADCTFANKR